MSETTFLIIVSMLFGVVLASAISAIRSAICYHRRQRSRAALQQIIDRIRWPESEQDGQEKRRP